jgi:hypothetical protein
MDILRKTDLKELIGNRAGVCVSLYMTAHRVGREQQQDPIRLKNLLNCAELELTAQGMRTPDAKALLQPGDNLLSNSDFWQHQSNGLAVFISADKFHTYRLPQPFEELCVIADHFNIKPLIPLLSSENHFYILALSLNKVRLFLGSRYTIGDIPLSDIPTSLDETLWFEEPQKHLEFHTSTSTPSASGQRSAMFHGHGAQKDDDKEKILRYFQILDKGLQEFLLAEDAPLILAGVDYLLPIYRKVNSYTNLVTEVLTGNPDELSAQELHQQAWEIVQPIFHEDRGEAFQRYQQLSGTGSELASNDLVDIVKASYYGAVETLFVALGTHQWGIYDPQDNKVKLDAEATPHNQDLLDFAAAYTLANSGTVYALEPTDLPGRESLSAIFRYSLNA